VSALEPELFDDGPAALAVGPTFVCFELKGKPGHKGRHRSRVVIPKEAWTYGGRGPRDRWLTDSGVKRIWIQNYPDADTDAYEKVLAEAAALFMRGKAPSQKPVALLVHAFLEVPKSWSKKERRDALRGAILPTSRPDADNYGKIVDALNEIVWKDDSQVCDFRVIKRYSDVPALRIEVREFLQPGCLS
jgi:Holliday junction resolvase RusA-like endonuclease